MPRLPLAAFIAENRGELDAAIRRALGDPNFNLDDDERELWIANDEGLYLWAKSEGVNVDGEEDTDNDD